jgi:hypothetical protein
MDTQVLRIVAMAADEAHHAGPAGPTSAEVQNAYDWLDLVGGFD